MSFRGRDNDAGSKMDMNESRRYGNMDNDRGGMNDEMDDRRFDSSRGRRPPFGRGRRPSPPNRDRNNRDFFGRDEPPMLRDRSPLRGSDDRFNDRFKKEDRSMNFPSGPPPRMPTGGFPKPNECEIIVVNKNHRVYAESVEARVKEIGIVVDMLFLKDEALLTQTIDDIARRGSLYAMVISPQNETHRSVTVNILHGTPQEHRNMPLEDALKLLGQNFHKHVRLQREKMERERAERGPYVGNVSADREIQLLLRMLADGRWLSETELTAVIRYLTERRDKITGNAEEDRRIGRTPIPPANIKMDQPPFQKDNIDVAQKEQDLQNRIMNIMNQGAPTSSSQNTNMLSSNDIPLNRGNQSFGANTMNPPSSGSTNIPGLKTMDDKLSTSRDASSALGDTQTGGDAAPPSTFINFGDPSVQKALDNLIQTGPNILKNIKSSLSNQPQSSLLGNTSKPPISSTGMGSPNDAMGMPRDGMGSARGPSGLSDISGNANNRGPGNLDMGPPRGPGGLSDLGGPRPRGNVGSSDGMGMGPPGRFGGMSDMGGMSSQHNFGGNNMQDSGMGQQRMSDVNRMGPPRGGNMGMGSGGPRGMGNDFPGQNQFDQFKGPGNQPGSYSGGSFNSGPGMGNMRQEYGGMGRRPGGRY
ncbi:nuclear receptor coactivator 5 isoform X3 [Parasteatoda tepidariorum]|uniref:nuclear receptor coactivator 5 isoform X3 n=1 Tax=Parasteatoda tepidariorum TaxID=114398 RepID=UPI001C71C0C0|nr:nuclear receptor coactivator 5 isoform X2 [Parasteatoda tepidariorum]